MSYLSSKHYWLAASVLPGIGPIRFLKWLTHFLSIKEFFSADDFFLRQIGLTTRAISAIRNINWDTIQKLYDRVEKTNTQLLTLEDPDYPALLREIRDPPLVLYIKGDIKLLAQPQLAIVGSRNPTSLGSELAETFAKALAKAGWTITSGLAMGIDTASHKGALTGGKTIAVLGSGINTIYPFSNKKLAAEIAEKGALISEYTFDVEPKAAHFPLRNRIISGLSVGVLVVEAALKSGSLLTAKYALEQGREVFAIPGSIYNPLVRGCHHLIKQGAKLVETSQDVLEELGAFVQLICEDSAPKAKRLPALDSAHQKLLDKMGHFSISIDTLVSQSGLTTKEVSSMLLALELRGYVQAVSGGYMLKHVIND